MMKNIKSIRVPSDFNPSWFPEFNSKSNSGQFNSTDLVISYQPIIYQITDQYAELGTAQPMLFIIFSCKFLIKSLLFRSLYMQRGGNMQTKIVLQNPIFWSILQPFLCTAHLSCWNFEFWFIQKYLSLHWMYFAQRVNSTGWCMGYVNWFYT